MPHEDLFFETALIEFSIWEDRRGEIIKKYERFEDIPKYIMNGFQGTVQLILKKPPIHHDTCQTDPR